MNVDRFGIQPSRAANAALKHCLRCGCHREEVRRFCEPT
jgi:hypothetical protein